MAKTSCEIILCFFFFILSFRVISVSAQQTCDNTAGSFKPNSTYDNNRRLLLSTFASNVTAQNGYFNGSFGLGTDRVYAMGMCAPGAEPDVCSNCIKNTAEGLLQICLNQTDGFSWSGEETLCLVRYSNKSFSGLLGLEPSNDFFNVNEIRKEDQKEFDSVFDELMFRTIQGASSSVRNNSNSLSLSGKYYAKDVAPEPVYGNISVVMQCTPDVSSKDCNLCLERSLDFYKKWYNGKRGTIILRPSCFFRWELYTFFGAFDSINARHPPPPPRPLSPPPLKTPSVTNQTNITKKNDSRISGGTIAAIVVVVVVTIILIVVGLVICKRRKQKQEIELPTESVQFDLKTIEAATGNFSEHNKLGAGGFGEVYKGMLLNGTEIAVKRLSKTSGQGEIEFKNEVVVVAKLQHINLVRLLGFSLQGEEKLLVYEFVPNKSLDYFLFDPNKRNQLDWTVRRNIIGGITRGILYLHQDSRLKIIHRDLKASNILLDADMNPKIADFGMARIFGVDQTVANTARVVGTFGYMSPEYVTHGQFSMKSDVYSFGVLILEIISGKKNSSFYQMDGLVNNLVTYVWKLWENKTMHELIDPFIKEDCKSDEVIRYVHIGLLCVQENPADRPTMSTIHQVLTTSSITLPVPQPPGFFFRNGPGSNPSSQGMVPGQSSSKSFTSSVDEATITQRRRKSYREIDIQYSPHLSSNNLMLTSNILNLHVPQPSRTDGLDFSISSAQKCGKTGLFKPNDKYDINRHLLLSSLASNVSARGGFYNASIGQGPDRLYASGTCIQGSEPELCSACIDSAFIRVIKKCHNQTEALDWSSFNEEYPYFQVNLTEFYQKWEALMLGVIADAISSPNPKFYGAGTGKIGIQTVYAFVLCSKDISPWNCSRCLRGNVDNYKLSCSGKPRGHSFSPSCYMRWDLYQFYGFIEYRASPTLPREKDGGKISTRNILGITVALAFFITVLLVLGYALSRRRKAYQEFATERRSMTTYGTAPPDDGKRLYSYLH
ncbi:cysteine-rich receptor-like protein kinase 17 [Arabidopsis thaliana]|uniref:Cysteine-rich receptor-like protein kinase 17 n=1 Tax=Arabidopsis thaliana TaxID=3702 RepID=A0A1P8B8K3_ARATH|nr:cysteine-rich receptor-like protein kinase 17 [Arabidopsis thaliana]ANM67932.1 cysteine-rich receptor-like protein kinase 17 [Arabidopsis thaliana]|eukprot:NP_001329725.1 cysteine-rich receptor-like protein kinase 17 [Arabidopsis thaliana]